MRLFCDCCLILFVPLELRTSLALLVIVSRNVIDRIRFRSTGDIEMTVFQLLRINPVLTLSTSPEVDPSMHTHTDPTPNFTTKLRT